MAAWQRRRQAAAPASGCAGPAKTSTPEIFKGQGTTYPKKKHKLTHLGHVDDALNDLNHLGVVAAQAAHGRAKAAARDSPRRGHQIRVDGSLIIRRSASVVLSLPQLDVVEVDDVPVLEAERSLDRVHGVAQHKQQVPSVQARQPVGPPDLPKA